MPKVNWSTGDTITAAKLNQMGDFVLEEAGRIDYDLLRMLLPLYYSGHFSGPDIAGTKALTFDGFQDTLRVSSNSGLTIDTSGKKAIQAITIPAATPFSYMSAGSGLNNSGNYICGTFTAGNWGKIKSARFATWYALSAGATIWAQIRTVDVNNRPTTTVLAQTDAKTQSASTNASDLMTFSGANSIKLTSGQKYAIVFYTSVAFSTHYSINGSANFVYAGLSSNGTTWTDLSTSQCGGGELSYDQEVNQNGMLVTTTKTIDFSPAKVVLVASVKELTPGTITPKINLGGVDLDLTLSSSRADPLDGTYTEKWYELLNPSGGSAFAKFLFQNQPINQQMDLKRYGLFIL